MQNVLNTIIRSINNTTIDKCKDTGQALTLLFIILFHVYDQPAFLTVALFVLLVTMIYPKALKIFAVAWFGLAEVLGKITSRILFTLSYILLVLPVGIARQIAGKDSLMLKAWKTANSSVFQELNKIYSREDLVNPY